MLSCQDIPHPDHIRVRRSRTRPPKSRQQHRFVLRGEAGRADFHRADLTAQPGDSLVPGGLVGDIPADLESPCPGEHAESSGDEVPLGNRQLHSIGGQPAVCILPAQQAGGGGEQLGAAIGAEVQIVGLQTTAAQGRGHGEGGALVEREAAVSALPAASRQSSHHQRLNDTRTGSLVPRCARSSECSDG